jgi:hypothetical protein
VKLTFFVDDPSIFIAGNNINAVYANVSRIMLGVSMRSSYRQRFKKLHILALPSVYIAETLMYVKKNINSYTSSQVHLYNTRGKNNLHTIPHSTTLFSESFIHTGLQLYNTLPGCLLQNSNINFRLSYIKIVLIFLMNLKSRPTLKQRLDKPKTKMFPCINALIALWF